MCLTLVLASIVVVSSSLYHPEVSLYTIFLVMSYFSACKSYCSLQRNNVPVVWVVTFFGIAITMVWLCTVMLRKFPP